MHFQAIPRQRENREMGKDVIKIRTKKTYSHGVIFVQMKEKLLRFLLKRQKEK